jgi:hypothetical protein
MAPIGNFLADLRRGTEMIRALIAAPLLVATLLPAPAAALTILGTRLPSAPPASAVGGGDLDSAFRAAADRWEAAILDDHTVTIYYGWAPLPDLLGFGFATEANGRTTGGSIVLTNAEHYRFFADATPWTDEEYSPPLETLADLGSPEGPLNVGRVLAAVTAEAGIGYDLLSLVLHEIGHALGFVGEFSPHGVETLDGDVDVSPPLPFAGASLPVTADHDHLTLPTSLMYPFFGLGERKLLSAADILGVAQVNGFTHVILDPVPEPASLLLVVIGVTILAAGKRRSARRAGDE